MKLKEKRTTKYRRREKGIERVVKKNTEWTKTIKEEESQLENRKLH